MAIYHRDRDFYKLFSEIDVNVIPLKYIKDITCTLSDGNKVVIDSASFKSVEGYQDIGDAHLETIIKQLDFYQEMTDLQIRINYEDVGKAVETKVTQLLDGNA